MLLQSVLAGKARKIFSQLSITESANFNRIKERILKGYELVPVPYLKKFRNLTKGHKGRDKHEKLLSIGNKTKM